jgi:glucosamine--fructose-6-phosphate aminotransferase (isomerizing)
MCGIWGFSGGQPDVNELMRVAELAEDRGGHSSGFFGIRPDGSQVLVKTVKSDPEDLLYAAEECVCGIGHARLATEGAVTMHNAQPILLKDMAVVHNGTIEDHLDLMHFYEYDPHTELDSEALVPMIRNGVEPLPGAGLLIALKDYSHSFHHWSSNPALHKRLMNQVTYYCSKKWPETT